ncbi:hypothetical protein RC86_16670 [Pectobacterium brasiliense]|uniref:Short-chain dehydrogenase n=2 Tax=Pectobacterium TaxID=122277 RepID=A0AAW3SS87_9GAMM|nr:MULTISPECIES: hypothetical protein [Pectobacterium]KHS88642.1 hypothetical protein RC86_16670 [Pectobacterium brasiliense]MBA5203365.1 hypothetical protein [Pectobacterium aroidearum]MBN3341736.1 hypothetical protein [Pectobacterium brasiliense]URG47456.1 hypothetical protein IG609_011470 [Pectobacterium quasiaquaticum]
MEQDKVSDNDFPTPNEFFLSVAMYETYKWDDTIFDKVLDLCKFQGAIDTYCVECKDRSLFVVNYPDHWASRADFRTKLQDPYILVVQAKCSRVKQHIACYVFRVYEKDGVTKIGQYPSAADAAKQDLKKYRKVLNEEHQKGYTKALGLFSHGVGAGSIVYLRKIFEHLIEEAHQEASKDGAWMSAHGERYLRLKMANKVKVLKDFLPSDLVQHPKLYGFLSQGLHNCPEEECLKLFPMLRLAIEFILSQKLERLDKKQRREALEKLLNSTQT